LSSLGDAHVFLQRLGTMVPTVAVTQQPANPNRAAP
jgi:hypothetical protein